MFCVCRVAFALMVGGIFEITFMIIHRVEMIWNGDDEVRERERGIYCKKLF